MNDIWRRCGWDARAILNRQLARSRVTDPHDPIQWRPHERAKSRTTKGATVKHLSTGLAVVAAVGIIATGVLAGCAKSNQIPPSTAPIQVTVAADGKTVPLSKDQQLLVSLPANPSTGYSWNVTSLPSVLATTGEPSFVPDSKGATAAVGAGGTTTYTFRATGKGAGKLELGYLRPWEKGVPPEATYSLQIDVK
jgi:inhibitor of cysteine peptidase